MFTDNYLLARVKQLVTKDPTANMYEPTGIPPHIKMMEIIKAIYSQIQDLDANISSLGATITRAVQKGIEENDVRSGLLTLSTMEQKLSDLSKAMMNKIDEKFQAASSLLPPAINDENNSDIAGGNTFVVDNDSRVETSHGNQYKIYVNEGKFCDVPQGWTLPKCTLIEGCSMWCIGQPSYFYTNSRGEKVRAPIWPFALFRAQKLPKHLKNIWRCNFKPVFERMTGDDPIRVPTTNIEAYLDESFQQGMTRLRELSPWIFEKDRKIKPEAWTISQWCKCTAKGYNHDEVIR